MKNVTITDLSDSRDVQFDQKIDSDTAIASGGGVAVTGDLTGSAVNTGRNSGILAGDDVDLEDSVVGDGNTQINDSEVGAFAGRGNATNAVGENVNLGRGDLIDVDSGGDAQVVTGNNNRVSGDVDIDVDGAGGPVNLAVGDDNQQQAVQDNSTTIEDSFNTDNSVEDSGNTTIDDSFNSVFEDNDTFETRIDDSFNSVFEDNDTTSFDISRRLDVDQDLEDNVDLDADLDVDI